MGPLEITAVVTAAIGIPASLARIWWLWWQSDCGECGHVHATCVCVAVAGSDHVMRPKR